MEERDGGDMTIEWGDLMLQIKERSEKMKKSVIWYWEIKEEGVLMTLCHVVITTSMEGRSTDVV